MTRTRRLGWSAALGIVVSGAGLSGCGMVLGIGDPYLIDAATKDASADTSKIDARAADVSTSDIVIVATREAASPIDDVTSVSDIDAGEPDAPGSEIPCAAGTKRCGACVAIDDPYYGCGPTGCDRTSCPDPGTGALVCQADACVIGACPDGKKKCGATCVDVDDAKYGCGFISCTPCPATTGASVICQGGACAVGSCPSGFKKCDDKCVAVGDVNYGCGTATCDKSSCPVAGTGALGCQAGACVIATCGAGMKKCGAKCVAVDDPTYGCAAATCDASACPAPGAGTLVCANSTCIIGTCGPGTKKCGSKCVPTDVNNGCADGAKCSACAGSESCVGTPSKCQCIANNDACTGKNCDLVVNNCGDMVSCGKCVAPQSCKGAGVANKCGCTPINPCSGGKCGKGLSDGCGGTVDCNCTGVNTCSGASVCGCTKKTCSGLCGPQADGCGGTMQCTPCCVPKTVCGANDCGMVPNGCGGTLSCKAAKTVCGTNDCGMVPNGCGGTLSCKAAKTVCGANDCGSVANGCGGVLSCKAPKTTCTSSECGTVPNGCGGSLVCAPCCTPKKCASGQCGSIDDGCNGTLKCATCTGTGETCNTTTHLCECKNNGQACSGKVCGKAMNNCGGFDTCQPDSCTAPPEAVAACQSNQCTVSCPNNANPLPCGTSSASACAYWDFASALDPSTQARGDGWDGRSPRIEGGRLAVGFNGPAGVSVNLRLCPSGASVLVDTRQVQVRFKVETNSPGAEADGFTTVQVYTLPAIASDKFISVDPPINQWVDATGRSKQTFQRMTDISVGVSFGIDNVVGTLYVEYLYLL